MQKSIINVADFFRLYCVSQARIAEFARTGYDLFEVGLEDRKKQIEAMIAIMGISALASVAVVVSMNRGKGRKYEERLFDFLSPPFLFFIMELFSGQAMLALGWFIGLSALCWTASYFVSTHVSKRVQHEAISRSESHSIVWDLEGLDALSLQPAASTRAESFLNGARFIKKAAFSYAAAFVLLTREMSGETESLPYWSYEVIALLLTIPACVGYHADQHPKFARGFLALCVDAVEVFSFSYTTCSALFSLVLSEEEIEMRRLLYIHICAYIALGLGLFAAARMDFDFEKNRAENIAMINTIKNIPAKLSETAASTGEKIKIGKQRLFHYCCIGSESKVPDGVDETSLLNPV